METFSLYRTWESQTPSYCWVLMSDLKRKHLTFYIFSDHLKQISKYWGDLTRSLKDIPCAFCFQLINILCSAPLQVSTWLCPPRWGWGPRTWWSLPTWWSVILTFWSPHWRWSACCLWRLPTGEGAHCCDWPGSVPCSWRCTDMSSSWPAAGGGPGTC